MNCRFRWSEKEDNIMRDMFPDNYTKDVCKVLNRSYQSVVGRSYTLRLLKSEKFFEMQKKDLADRIKEGRNPSFVHNGFKKGIIPHNKGKKMDEESLKIMSKTFFQKRHIPHNALPPFSEVKRLDKRCNRLYIYIKLPNERKLVVKHQYLWKSVHGEIPKGHKVVFKDGNTLNCVIDNLELVSNAELMVRNSIVRYPALLGSTIRVLGRLKRTIKNKEKHGKEQNAGFEGFTVC